MTDADRDRLADRVGRLEAVLEMLVEDTEALLDNPRAPRGMGYVIQDKRETARLTIHRAKELLSERKPMSDATIAWAKERTDGGRR